MNNRLIIPFAIIAIAVWNLIISFYLLNGNCLPACFGLPVLGFTILTLLVFKYLNKENEK